MNISVDLYPQKQERVVILPDGSDGMSLMKALGLAPDVHIIVRDNVPIPIDEKLHDLDKIRVIAVVSGG